MKKRYSRIRAVYCNLQKKLASEALFEDDLTYKQYDILKTMGFLQAFVKHKNGSPNKVIRRRVEWEYDFNQVNKST